MKDERKGQKAPQAHGQEYEVRVKFAGHKKVHYQHETNSQRKRGYCKYMRPKINPSCKFSPMGELSSLTAQSLPLWGNMSKVLSKQHTLASLHTLASELGILGEESLVEQKV